MSPARPSPPKENSPKRQRLIIGFLLSVVLLGGIVSFLLSGGKSTKTLARSPDVTVCLLPPPPLPLPKVEQPKSEPPPEAKKKEIVEQEPDPVEPPPEAVDPAPPAEVLGTNNKGSGPGIAGVGTSGNGGGNRNTIGGGSNQARIDWFAKRILVTTIKQALERDPSTKQIVMDDGIRLWVDKDGRVTRVKPLGSISNFAAVERVLIGLQTSQLPPVGMPSYIDFKIKARKAAL